MQWILQTFLPRVPWYILLGLVTADLGKADDQGATASPPSASSQQERPRLTHPLDEWHERSPLPTSRTLNDIAFDGDQYVVPVGAPDGRVLVSRDLTNWEWRSLGLREPLEPQRIVFNGDRQVLIAGDRIWQRSSWKSEWIESSGLDDPPFQIRVVNGEFWAWREGGMEGWLSRHKKGNTGTRTESTLYRSRDGLTWGLAPIPGLDSRFYGIDDLVYAEETYLLVAGGELFHSREGGNWTRVQGHEQKAIRSIAYGNGNFVACGDLHVGSSGDGLTWSFDEHPFVRKYHRIDPIQGDSGVRTEGRQVRLAYTDDQFVALASREDIERAQTSFSRDGKTWSLPVSVPSGPISLREAGGKAFAVGEGGSLWMAGGPEARFRQVLPVLPWTWNAVAANEERVVVGGDGGHVAWSTDAATFHPVLLPEPAAVADIVWAPELARFVAVGGEFGPPPSTDSRPQPAIRATGIQEYGRVWVSSDGKEWTSEALPASIGRITGIAWNGSTLVLCGRMGWIATSPDGKHWTARESGTDQLIYDVVWGGGNFVATAMEGLVLTSTDGTHWSIGRLGNRITSFPGPSPVYSNGTWIIHYGSSAYLSEDLKSWRTENTGYVSSPVVHAFGEFIASGSHLRLVSSTDGIRWTPRTDRAFTRGEVYSYSGFRAAARFRQQVVFVGWGGRISVSGTWP
jgi:hypothetical protein